MSEPHISQKWATVYREYYDSTRTYTHVCPFCHYSYKDECEEGYAICPNCKKELMQEEK